MGSLTIAGEGEQRKKKCCKAFVVVRLKDDDGGDGRWCAKACGMDGLEKFPQ